MKEFKEKYGPLALVAGASEGLGAAWAKALAARGMDLVLVARRKEKLDELSIELMNHYKIKAWPIVCDLGSPDAVSYIMSAIENRTINCLVYNAASSYIGSFIATPYSTHANIAMVNMFTPLHLVHALAGPMLEKRKGAIILMSSLAGFQGSGFLATYAASKAFTRVLAESLWYEWKAQGVDVVACCPGATATPNYIDSKPGKMGFLAPRPQLPENVVEECLRKIGKTPFFISGIGNKLAVFFMRHIFSRKRAVIIMGDATRKLYHIAD